MYMYVLGLFSRQRYHIQSYLSKSLWCLYTNMTSYKSEFIMEHFFINVLLKQNTIDFSILKKHKEVKQQRAW